MIKLIDNYDEVDAKNVEVFAKMETGARYTCVICGKSTGIEDSMSSAGRKLICRDCYEDKSKFESMEDVLDFVHGVGKYWDEDNGECMVSVYEENDSNSKLVYQKDFVKERNEV